MDGEKLLPKNREKLAYNVPFSRVLFAGTTKRVQKVEALGWAQVTLALNGEIMLKFFRFTRNTKQKEVVELRENFKKASDLFVVSRTKKWCNVFKGSAFFWLTYL